MLGRKHVNSFMRNRSIRTVQRCDIERVDDADCESKGRIGMMWRDGREQLAVEDFPRQCQDLLERWSARSIVNSTVALGGGKHQFDVLVIHGQAVDHLDFPRFVAHVGGAYALIVPIPLIEETCKRCLHLVERDLRCLVWQLSSGVVAWELLTMLIE
jgi:hypothetical protein